MARKPRYQVDQDKFLTHEEEDRLVKSLDNAPKRDMLLVMLALKTGARASELLNLRLYDLKTTHKEVFIKGLKGSLNRSIPLSESLFDEVYIYSKTIPNEKIFDISYPRLVQIWDKYRPNGKSFHSLRHTFAMRLFTKHQNLRLVQVALGHTNIKNTMVYADYYYSTEELRKYLVD